MVDIKSEVQKALEILKAGGIILYPTDTIWGLGCDATNDAAVQRIYDLKKRLDTKSMLLLIDQESKLQRYVRDVPEVAWDLIDSAENPLTIVYPDAYNISKLLSAEDGSIGIRITSHPFCKSLIQRLGKPLVSTSANISGKPHPSSAKELDAEIINGVDYMVDASFESRSTKPSSIIKLEKDGKFKIIRK